MSISIGEDERSFRAKLCPQCAELVESRDIDFFIQSTQLVLHFFVGSGAEKTALDMVWRLYVHDEHRTRRTTGSSGLNNEKSRVFEWEGGLKTLLCIHKLEWLLIPWI